MKQSRVLREQKEELQATIEDLGATQAKLVQSEKMASLGELTAGIAHEIQNPLNFVNNFSELNIELLGEMQEEITAGNFNAVTGLVKNLAENEEKINFHGKRADAIVKGMLQHSRANTGTREPVDINKLVDECIRLSYHGLRAKDKSFNAEMHVKLDPSLQIVQAVPQDIGRVLLNLFTNAFYSVAKKEQVLQAKNTGKKTVYEPMVFVSTRNSKDNVIINVRDNGIGIPKQLFDKIFQPFFTTKPAGEGTGLGLSMSYEIITQGHHGDFSVNSQEGEFAEFVISLPVYVV
jgi:two-component system NtrC family sensor kinase